MPLNLNQKDRKLFLGAGFIFVLLVVAALVIAACGCGLPAAVPVPRVPADRVPGLVPALVGS